MSISTRQHLTWSLMKQIIAAQMLFIDWIKSCDQQMIISVIKQAVDAINRTTKNSSDETQTSGTSAHCSLVIVFTVWWLHWTSKSQQMSREDMGCYWRLLPAWRQPWLDPCKSLSYQSRLDPLELRRGLVWEPPLVSCVTRQHTDITSSTVPPLPSLTQASERRGSKDYRLPRQIECSRKRRRGTNEF